MFRCISQQLLWSFLLWLGCLEELERKMHLCFTRNFCIRLYICFGFYLFRANPICLLFALPFFSFGIGGLFTIMMSMTSDVIDLDELNTGKRREGIFGAIYWWMVKFGFAFAGLANRAIMASVGFVRYVNQKRLLLEYAFFLLRFTILGHLVLCGLCVIMTIQKKRHRN